MLYEDGTYLLKHNFSDFRSLIQWSLAYMCMYACVYAYWFVCVCAGVCAFYPRVFFLNTFFLVLRFFKNI